MLPLLYSTSTIWSVSAAAASLAALLSPLSSVSPPLSLTSTVRVRFCLPQTMSSLVLPAFTPFTTPFWLTLAIFMSFILNFTSVAVGRVTFSPTSRERPLGTTSMAHLAFAPPPDTVTVTLP